MGLSATHTKKKWIKYKIPNPFALTSRGKINWSLTVGHQEVAHSVLEPKEGTDKAAQAWAKWGEIAWQRRAYSIKDKGKRTKHVERKRRDSSQQHRATVQLDMNVNSVVWKRRRDDKGENEMKGGVWILGMNKAACHKPEDLNSRGWDSVTIRSLGKGKAEDTAQSEADRLEGRAQPNWRGREPVWCGLRKSIQRAVPKREGNCTWESRAHTDTAYPPLPTLNVSMSFSYSTKA